MGDAYNKKKSPPNVFASIKIIVKQTIIDRISHAGHMFGIKLEPQKLKPQTPQTSKANCFRHLTRNGHSWSEALQITYTKCCHFDTSQKEIKTVAALAASSTNSDLLN